MVFNKTLLWWHIVGLYNRAAASYSKAPGHRGNMWESDPPPVNCEHILAKSDDLFPSHLYMPPPLPALIRLLIEFPSRSTVTETRRVRLSFLFAE